MNTNDNLEDDFNTFSLSPESRDYLITSAKWAKIIGITSLVSIGVGLLGALAFVFFGGFLFGSGGGMGDFEFMMFIYLAVSFIFVLIASIPFYFLYKFAAETNANLVEFKGVPLSNGIVYLKSFFKTIVLSALTIIALYMIVFVVAMNYNF
jgi:hypothetical protein